MSAALGRLGACTIFAVGLLLPAQPVRGQDTADAQELDTAALLDRSFMHSWRLAIGLHGIPYTMRDTVDVFADEFDLVRDQVTPVAIDYAFDRFWILDDLCFSGKDCGPGPSRAFAYTSAGRHDPDFNFALEPDVGWEGLTSANGLLYLVGYSYSGEEEDRDNVFAYTEAGERVPEAEFKLESDHNYNPRGIVHVDGRFYVLDSGQDGRRRAKVYAYTTTGERIPSADFDLGLREADFPRVIAYADGLFHIDVMFSGVLDDPPDNVLIYRPDGKRVGSSRFRRTTLTDMTFANDRFYVLDDYSRVCAYTLTGKRVLIDHSVTKQRWCKRE